MGFKFEVFRVRAHAGGATLELVSKDSRLSGGMAKLIGRDGAKFGALKAGDLVTLDVTEGHAPDPVPPAVPKPLKKAKKKSSKTTSPSAGD